MSKQSRERRIIVVGCGVVGLTTATYLTEHGYNVEIWTRETPERTTSAVAGGIWHPFQVDENDTRVADWSHRTLHELQRLAAVPGSGVCLREGMEVYRTHPHPLPSWHRMLSRVEKVPASRLPKDCVEGYRFQVPVVETPVYLGKFLMGRFLAAGGSLKTRTVTCLSEPWSEADWVVNCTGLGARELVGDHTLYPIRGEVLRLKSPPTSEFLLDHDHPGGHTYILPRLSDCVLGGTCDEHVWSLEPSQSAATAIRKRCAEWIPAIDSVDAYATEHLVGLRPGRPRVRLEREISGDGKTVVHNYGHGGSGYTLSWGCAEDAERLLAWKEKKTGT